MALSSRLSSCQSKAGVPESRSTVGNKTITSSDGSTPQQYYLRGPIESGESVFLVADQQIGDRSYLSFLTLGVGSEQGNIIFDPTPVDITRVPTFTVFPVTGTNQLLIRNSLGGLPGLSSENGVVRYANSATPLIFETDQVNPWGLLLAGVYYTARTPAGTTLGWRAYVPQPTAIPGAIPIQVQNTATGDPQTTTITKIRAVPLRYYYVGNCSRSVSRLDTAIMNEVNWYQGGTVGQTMTRLTDCQGGIFYNYCTGTDLCSQTCAGPCPNTDNICGYNSATQTLSCLPPGPTPPPTPWWRQIPTLWWVIAGVLGFLLIIFVIVIIVIVVRRRG